MKKKAAGENVDEKCCRQKILPKECRWALHQPDIFDMKVEPPPPYKRGFKSLTKFGEFDKL